MKVRILGGPYDNQIADVPEGRRFVKFIIEEKVWPFEWNAESTLGTSIRMIRLPIEWHTVLGMVVRWSESQD